MQKKMIGAVIALTAVGAFAAGTYAQVAPPAFGGMVAVMVPASKSPPADGTLRYRRPLAIDDGSCGPNMVFLIVGGNNSAKIPRMEVGCVPLANGVTSTK